MANINSMVVYSTFYQLCQNYRYLLRYNMFVFYVQLATFEELSENCNSLLTDAIPFCVNESLMSVIFSTWFVLHSKYFHDTVMFVLNVLHMISKCFWLRS